MSVGDSLSGNGGGWAVNERLIVSVVHGVSRGNECDAVDVVT